VLSTLKSGTPAENAARMRAVFAGEAGPHRDFVLLNSGAALVAAGKADDIKTGVGQAAAVIDSGAASRSLEAFVGVSRSFASQ
jgi:anthranilate phosphoribosyltransferase